MMKGLGFALASVLAVTGCGKKSDHSSNAPDGHGGGDAGPAAPSDEAMSALLKSYCAGCHATEHPRANVVLDTLDGAKASAARAAGEVEDRSMPPARAQAQPTDAERASMVAWFKAQPH